MTTPEAKANIKAINRHMRKRRAMETRDPRLTSGWDYNTWRVCYPALSAVYQSACEVFTGRTGRFVPTV